MDPSNVRATSLVYASNGASLDPRNFYATSYSSFHGHVAHQVTGMIQNSSNTGIISSNGFSGIKKPSTTATRRTGFAANLHGWVPYEKKIDEKGFKIEAPFQTETAQQHDPPGRPKDYGPVKVIGSIESGCTTMRKNTLNPAPAPPTPDSYAVISWRDPHLGNKSAMNDLAKILPARTGAFVSDAPAKIHRFGSGDGRNRFIKTPPSLPGISPAAEPDHISTPPTKIPRIPALMREDAFTRSSRPGLLKTPPHVSTTPLPPDAAESHALKRRDPTYWTSLRDPKSIIPTSRMLHPPISVTHAADHIVGPTKTIDTNLVKKEYTGAAKQNRPWNDIPEPNPGSRFTTDNDVRYAFESGRYGLFKPQYGDDEYTHGPIAYSGIAHNYINRPNPDAPTDEEIVSNDRNPLSNVVLLPFLVVGSMSLYL
ncbi:hypothetical protein SmJEL517_g05930 [Synchytrium microbalum]|uniref:Uncharacterized protein n=1 Tax=Synchytrium microbalum TaxID=1806994 RepID=A0A507BTZ1_9FUNG|nr:uncharacterized protein SmJEL517_g05930 [Synchytrium microbalum]TPX30519.1 hypothetical protein SmJEL517_g05930 [Synchytrium microbalum]